MEIHNISLKNSVANNFMAEIRDIKVQNDRLRFRKNLSRLGEILAYEMSKSLDFSEKNIMGLTAPRRETFSVMTLIWLAIKTVRLLDMINKIGQSSIMDR